MHTQAHVFEPRFPIFAVRNPHMSVGGVYCCFYHDAIWARSRKRRSSRRRKSKREKYGNNIWVCIADGFMGWDEVRGRERERGTEKSWKSKSCQHKSDHIDCKILFELHCCILIGVFVSVLAVCAAAATAFSISLENTDAPLHCIAMHAPVAHMNMNWQLFNVFVQQESN